MNSTTLALALVLSTAAIPAHAQQAATAAAADDYVPSLITDTPLQGRQLAITLVRKTIGTIQKDGDAKRRVREKYEEDPMMLMRATELVAIEFRTIAEANNYWRDRKPQGE
ncbi:MAG: hexameric tyrosine-coordinated heme protein [Luteimonas sp.]|nr:hexameric tyrosine-coordinated heme protein [Luteimonas sp.]